MIDSLYTGLKYKIGDQRLDPLFRVWKGKAHLIVWNDNTESHIWWDLVLPLAKKIAGPRLIVIADIDTDIKPDPDRIFPIISMDCSKIKRDRLKAIVRREPEEPLSKILTTPEGLPDKQNSLFYFHSVHKTKENLHGLVSIVLDKMSTYVVFSGLSDQSDCRRKIINWSVSDKCEDFYFENSV